MPVGTNVPEQDTTIPTFYYDPQPDDAATKEAAGNPKYKNVLMVRIAVPSTGFKEEVVRPAEEKDKQRWPVQYQRFVDGETHKVDGTPLSEFSTATEADRASLKAAGLQTIEQVATLNDDFAQRLHVVALRNKAQKYLAAAADIGKTAQLQAEIETLKKRIKELENANNPATVSGRNEDSGVHASDGDNVERSPGRPPLDSNSKRGGKRPGKRAELEKVDL